MAENSLKVDVIANDGSPLEVSEKSIFGEDGRMGIGGAELAILTLCKGWHDKGYDVTFYNDPKVPNGSCFRQLPIGVFNPDEDRDILIVFRSPNERVRGAKGKKVWFSCDQNTVGDFSDFSSQVEKIVTISPLHSQYFKDTYRINNTIPIDLPVRTWEYEHDVEKVSHRCIFTSMPDRGIMCLHAAWPLIIREVPDASLVITSDWRLWAEWANEEMTKDYRLAFMRHPNVTYLGAINRRQLIQEQLKASLHIYPSTYQELFCIAVAESEVAGTLPITSDCGAIATTNMGEVICGNPHDPAWINKFVEKVVYYLTHDEERISRAKEVQQKAIERFSLDNILQQWDEKVFYG